MAEWKKIITSGSQAELAGVTGSFTGSFFGDGSGLTGVSSFSVSGDVNNRVITADGAGGGVGETNLTFDGSTLTVTGALTATTTTTLGSAGNFTISDDGVTAASLLQKAAGRAVRIGDPGGLGNSVELVSDDAANEVKLVAPTGTATISGSTVNVATSADTINLNATTIDIPNVSGGEDNTVVVYNGSTLLTDEIDPKVWEGNLVDKQGTPVQYQVATFNDSDTLVGSSNFTFNNSTLSVTGTINASSTITGSGLQLTSVPAGTDNTVLVLNAAGGVVTDEIDSRVWGSTLVDGSGLADGYITFASDSDTITGAADFTYTSDTKTLSVTNATITGNLIVQGTTTELQVTNLNVEDQFILLNSGSAGADTGIIFGGAGGTPNQGAALYFDNNDTRLSVASSIAAHATSATTAGYITIAYDVDTAGHSAVPGVGNIKIEGGEAFIYA